MTTARTARGRARLIRSKRASRKHGPIEGHNRAAGESERSRPVEIDVIARPGSRAVGAARCRRFLKRIAGALRICGGEVSVLFCDDTEIAGMNLRFLGKDRPTDVLSFPSGELPAPGRHIGDIAISTDTARRQAKRAGRRLEGEALTLLAHGFLHLLGYDHETDEGEMMRLQRQLCRDFLPAPRTPPPRPSPPRVRRPSPGPAGRRNGRRR